jgi:predicted AAA+ superfamily ATPase
MGNVTETMVGRAGLIELLSMTAFELNANNVPSLLHKGGYPAIYTLGEEPEKFFRNYLKYYLEREIRLVHNIADFKKFQLFMKMCANRVGNLVNYDIMTSNLQVSRKVIDHWLSILELSYIIFMAPAYHNNFELTLTHQPKLYFYDTGLCAFLLGIEKEDDIPSHPMYGALFENLVFGDIRKKIMAANRSLETYFWHVPPKKQGAGGYEVDLIIVQGAKIKACEIKLSGTFDPHWLGRLNRFDEEKSKRLQECKKYIIYTGPTVQVEGGMAVNFKDVGILLGD